MKNLMFVLISSFMAIVLACSCGIQPASDSSSAEPDIEAFANNIGGSGIGMDSIPPLENPKYVGIGGMEGNPLYNMNDRDYVFLLQLNGHTLVYPRKIMVYHEIVNDSVDGYKFTMTY